MTRQPDRDQDDNDFRRGDHRIDIVRGLPEAELVGGLSWGYRIAVRHTDNPALVVQRLPGRDVRNPRAASTWLNTYEGHADRLTGHCCLLRYVILPRYWREAPASQPPPSGCHRLISVLNCCSRTNRG